MTQFNTPNIYYLEQQDFNSSLQLTSSILNPYTKKPLFSGLSILMVQGDFCGYCTQVKPAFQRLANELHGIDFATIQIDGQQPGEKFFQHQDEKDRISPLTAILGRPMEGVPLFVKMFNGVVVSGSEFQGNRDEGSLREWILKN